MRTPSVRIVAVSAAALTAAAMLPAVLTSSTATAGVTLAREGFERSLTRWSATSSATRLDRVAWGRGKHSEAARLRSRRSVPANVGVTDSPGLVRSSRSGARYVATVWVRASRDAHRSRALQVRLSLGERSGPHAWKLVRLNNSKWRQISVPFTARHDGRRLDVTIRALDLPRVGALLVDDVRVRRSQLPTASNRRLSGVRFGASVDEGRMEWHRAVRRSDDRYTRMEALRLFEPWIRDTWSGRLGDIKPRPVAVSFAARPGRVLSGDYDRALRRWFRDAPNRVPVWWTYWHEPEDDIAAGEISARQYRRAWRHINAIARRAGTPNLHPTLVLMAWTARPQSGRSVRKYYPGSFIDVMAWDGYNPVDNRSYDPPRHIFGDAAARSRKLGNRFAIAELGSLLVPGDDGSRRAVWLVQSAKFAAARNAAFVTYWDAKIPGEDFQLRDLPSRLAWRQVVKD